jgi:hypothetical protein
VIRRYLETCKPKDETDNTYSPMRGLAERAGVALDTLSKHLNGKLETMSFDMADGLLCAMNLVHLWWEDPLVHTYLAVDLSARVPAPKHRPRYKSVDAVCAAPDCEELFRTSRPGHIYHSKQCRSRVDHARAHAAGRR